MKYLEMDIWKKDGITRAYKKEYSQILNAPSRMKIHDLANACTYCNNWDNPYAREIIKRSGNLDRYEKARRREEKRRLFDDSCKKYGIQMF